MRNSEVVQPRRLVTVRRLLLLMIAIIVGAASSTATLGQQNSSTSPQPPTSSSQVASTLTRLLRQQAPTASPQRTASSTQVNSTPSIRPSYVLRQPMHSKLALVRPAQLQRELGRAAVHAQLVAPSLFPAQIRVGRTSNPGTCVVPPRNVQRVDHISFKEYVRNALPYEWYPSWPEASLDAGVVAVSQYAWVMMLQGKWTRLGYDFDVLDNTCDQVYRDRNPNVDYSRTDAAVERMFGVTLTHNGQLIETYYRARARLCKGIKRCLGQRESRDLALNGWSAAEILLHFYGPLDYWPGNPEAPAPAPAQALEVTQAPPSTPGEVINVGRTFDPSNCFPVPYNVQRVDSVSLKDYARNVLPYITNNNWSDAALDASVAAITQYVQATKAERKWTKFGHGFDVVDSTCDYPYNDRQSGWDYSRTDAAVNRVIP